MLPESSSSESFDIISRKSRLKIGIANKKLIIKEIDKQANIKIQEIISLKNAESLAKKPLFISLYLVFLAPKLHKYFCFV